MVMMLSDLRDLPMTIQLTSEQWARVQYDQEIPVHVCDPSQTLDFVLVKADAYERLRALFEDIPITEQERLFQLIQFGRRAGWDDPEMDIYNDLDPRQTP